MDEVNDLTRNEGIDVAFDAVPGATGPTLEALGLLRHGGTLVLAGAKGQALAGFHSDDLIHRGLHLVGAAGRSPTSTEAALSVLSADAYPFGDLHTHTFPLHDLDLAVRTLGGEVDGENPIHVSVVP